jgi:hypothetical protein
MPAIFLTSVRSPDDIGPARLLIESAREFGGAMAACDWWVFATNPELEDGDALKQAGVRVVPLPVGSTVRRWPYGDKVFACAAAEEQAGTGVEALVWLDLECLVVAPPVLLNPGPRHDLALRPVHVRNVGCPANGPLDTFWRELCRAVGIADTDRTVQPFMGGDPLRAYYNSHGFGLDPRLGLLAEWRDLFAALIADQAFVRDACTDIRHPIFLFQALFSALVAARVPAERVRLLPPTYNYPYNLHAQATPDRRPRALNEVVTLAYEDRPIHPDAIGDIEVGEPLRTWLSDHARTIAGSDGCGPG